MEFTTLEQVIRNNIPLPPRPTGSGWYQVLCPVCHDHGKKGLRAGFKFDNGVVAYHCFNCGPEQNTAYDPYKHEKMPHKMVRVLQAFGVPDEQWQQVLFDSLAKVSTNKKKDRPSPSKSIEPKVIPVPDTFYLLRDAEPTDVWAQVASEYLKTERAVDPGSYPFMLSEKTTIPYLKKWYKRVIIPIYKNNNLIFYLGRDLTGKAIRKYQSPSVDRDTVLYGYDLLFVNTDSPLFIVEGWFDAFAIDGVGIIGNEMSDSKIQWLNRSPRTKIYIPDKFGSGQIAANQALKAGWSISIPDVGNCKDMSEAVQKYGRLYVLQSIHKHVYTGLEAQVQIGINLE